MRVRTVALALLAIVACAPQEGTGGTAVSLTEFDIAVQGSLGPAPVLVPVRNDGEFGHTLVVSNAQGTVLAATAVLAPGDSADIELVLDPGEYLFTCRIVVERPDGEIVDHFAAGMSTPVTVIGA